MKNAHKLLELITNAFPLDPPRHHSLTAGSQLVLTIIVDNLFYPYTFDEADLARSPEDLVAEIVARQAMPRCTWCGHTAKDHGKSGMGIAIHDMTTKPPTQHWKCLLCGLHADYCVHSQGH